MATSLAPFTRARPSPPIPRDERGGLESPIMDEETRIALLEIKGSLAELRLNVTERFTTVNDRFADVNTKLDTIIDVLTEFRREYTEHTH
jgi:hypothetical protein